MLRALVICLTDLSPDEMLAGLTRIGWGQATPEQSDKHRDALLAQIAATDISAVTESLWYVIYSVSHDTFGLVNAPMTGRVTVRLFHDDLPHLKTACEDFVRGVQKALGEPDRRGIDRLDFHDDLCILPAKSTKPTARAEILTETRLHHLLEERRIEYRTARSALILALIIFAVTIPPAEAPFLKASPEWGRWFFGILERVGTAAITTFTMFCFDIVQRLRHLRENTVVRWL